VSTVDNRGIKLGNVKTTSLHCSFKASILHDEVNQKREAAEYTAFFIVLCYSMKDLQYLHDTLRLGQLGMVISKHYSKT